MSDEVRDLIDRATAAQHDRRLADAKSAWTAAIDLLRNGDDQLTLGRALRSLAEVDRKLHDDEAARAHYEEAVALYRQLDDPLALAHSVRHLGDVYRHAHELALAEPCYREALALYRAHPEAAPLDVANAIRSMAVLKSETGAVQAARELWEEAKQLYTATGIEAGVAESSRRLTQLTAQPGD
jgi:tetratricopeptide (TPR) repeat protein